MWSKNFFRSFKSYSVLKPFLDYDARLSNLDHLKANIRRRKLEVVVDEMPAFYENLKNLDKIKSELEASREIVREKLMRPETAKDENEKRKLTMTAKILREDHKQVKSAVMDLEQNLAKLMMRVPNDLSSKTPDEDEIVREKAVPRNVRGSHIEIGESLDLLEVKSPWGIFLKDEAAIFELEIVDQLDSELRKLGFLRFSNPDFAREILSEGCEGVFGSSVPLSPYDEHDDVTCLTGGAAPLPFFAFFAKSVLKKEALPLRCFAGGRRYDAGASPTFGLFQPRQTNAVQIFVVSSPSSKDDDIDDVISTLTDFYDRLDVPFRVVVKSASHLSFAETLRFSFEVFSPHFNQYFEVGHISSYGDLFSKNMNIHVKNGGKSDFARVVTGTVLRVGPLLGGILETKGTLTR